MRDLPTGTVTFLFTDIEGSTRLLHELGAEAYAQALAEHRRLLRDAFARHEGVEVDTQGDAFFVAFASAGGAVQAAAEGTHALASGPIRVRMGLHTGTPHLAEEGYVGADVHLGARIAACAHGGQVVLSQATRQSAEVDALDLGEHRLKDFSEPVWIYQLGQQRFPPLKTISNTNLPRPASSFVGREREVSEVISLLQDGARLVTLSGPGGSGKTRLSIEAAAELVPDFANGVFWVGLATLRDPALVSETIAQTLGARDGLAAHIGERELLLVLDNFEQVVEAAPELSSLLSACSNLRLLATSRELLRIQGEVDYPVPPLASPEAVELFCARSRLEPDEQIAELCRRLDDLPLAVELAAARTGVLSPAQILERLSQRLDLLRAGRDGEARQQTLRATIEWSYDLLTPEGQRLFARLSVFAGGCTLEAAEEVAEAELDTLQSLVDKSLLRHTGERFWMLETIREYALERFDELKETEQLHVRHFAHVLELAEQARAGFQGTGQKTWLQRIDAERDNVRGALGWSLSTGDSIQGLQLATALGLFWVVRDSSEGYRWLSEALGRADGAPPALRADALRWASSARHQTGDFTQAVELAEESLRLFRQLGDSREVASMLDRLAGAQLNLGQVDEGRASTEESLAIYEQLGDRRGALHPLEKLGWLEWQRGNRERGTELLEESLARAKEFGDSMWEAWMLCSLAEIELEQGDPSRAEGLGHESLTLSLELGNRQHVVYCVALLAGVAARQSDPERAGRLWGGLDALERAGDRSLSPGFPATLAEEAASLESAVASGREMSAEEVVSCALTSID